MGSQPRPDQTSPLAICRIRLLCLFAHNEDAPLAPQCCLIYRQIILTLQINPTATTEEALKWIPAASQNEPSRPPSLVHVPCSSYASSRLMNNVIKLQKAQHGARETGTNVAVLPVLVEYKTTPRFWCITRCFGVLQCGSFSSERTCVQWANNFPLGWPTTRQYALI